MSVTSLITCILPEPRLSLRQDQIQVDTGVYISHDLITICDQVIFFLRELREFFKGVKRVRTGACNALLLDIEGPGPIVSLKKLP